MRCRVLEILLIIFPLLASASLRAAETTGSIQGRVAAQDGSPLPGIAVTAGGGAPGTRTARSDGAGNFRFLALPPGTYRVSVAAEGFRPQERAVVVSLDSTTTADFRLSISREENVTVEGATPALDITSTEIGNSVDAKAFGRIPLARDYTSIAVFQPGVMPDSTPDKQGKGFSVFGATQLENSYYVDGVDSTGIRRGSQVKSLPVEFLQEVEVKTANYSAEYGRTFGGVVNAVTRSGGNDFHGEAFGYYDNQSLQASAKPGVVGGNFAGFTDEDFGASLGGYLLRDRLWFFGVYDYNAPRQDTTLTTGSGSPYDNSTFRSLDETQHLFAGKLTWNVSPSVTAVASVFGDPSTSSQQLVEDGPAESRQIHQESGKPDVALLGNAVGSSWAADLGVFRHEELLNRTPDLNPPFLTSDDSQVPTFDLLDCALPGCYSGAPWVFIPTSDPIRNERYRRDEIRGSATKTAGDHAVKGGIDYLRETGTISQAIPGGYDRILSALPDGTPLYTQSWFGDSTGLFGEDHVARSVSGNPKTIELAAFLQDEWKPTPGITVNAGVRYDDFRLDDAVTGSTLAHLRNNFAPRLGVAWDPSSDGRSKVTAAYGRFFDAIPLDIQAKGFRGTALTVTDVVGYSFDCGPTAVNCQSLPNNFSQPSDPGLRAPSSEQFTLGFERELSPGFTVGIQGIYSRLDRAVEDRCDLQGNDAAFIFSGNGCVLMNPGFGDYGRGRFGAVMLPDGSTEEVLCTNGLNPEEGRAAVPCPALPEAKRLYRGVALSASKRFSERAYLLASYVYSSLRGNYDGAFNELGEANPNSNLDFDYPQLLDHAYGRLANDRPHQAKVTGFYRLDFGLTGGINAYYRSGRPLDKFGSFNSVSGAPIPLYLTDRGSEGRTPADYDIDLHMDYAFHVEPVTVDVIADLFRVLNRQTVQQVNPFYNFDGFQADNGIQTNPNYGEPIQRSDPRLLRLGLRVTF